MELLQVLLDSFNWTQLLQPQFYIEHGGLWLLLFVVFAETGLFAGFFFPGDSLLFVAGIFAHEMTVDGVVQPGLAHQFLKLVGMGGVRNEWMDLFVLTALLAVAGILGNVVGYWTGRLVGKKMYTWKDGFFFKQRYLHQAHDFYEKHGGGAVIVARFLPFIRTFAPIVAGIVKMDQAKFNFYNIVGCIAWVVSMIFAGHFLQKWILDWFNFDLKEHLELIVLGIVVITTLPVIIKMITGKRKDSTPDINPL
jgi:membrane-associated protein